MRINENELRSLVEEGIRESLIGEIKRKKIQENMNKNIVRLSESQLHQVIKESVNRIISEIHGADNWEDTVADGIDAANDGSMANMLGSKLGDKVRRKMHAASGSNTRYKSPTDLRNQADRIANLASKTGRMRPDSAQRIKNAYDRA